MHAKQQGWCHHSHCQRKPCCCVPSGEQWRVCELPRRVPATAGLGQHQECVHCSGSAVMQREVPHGPGLPCRLLLQEQHGAGQLCPHNAEQDQRVRRAHLQHHECAAVL